MTESNNYQIGGDHYQAPVQHWDFVTTTKAGYLEGCATKYLCRHHKKDGRKDLQKSRHYIDKLWDWEKQGYKNASIATAADVEAFNKINNIGELEGQAIVLIFTWSTKADIAAAKAIVNTLIAEENG